MLGILREWPVSDYPSDKPSFVRRRRAGKDPWIIRSAGDIASVIMASTSASPSVRLTLFREIWCLLSHAGFGARRSSKMMGSRKGRTMQIRFAPQKCSLRRASRSTLIWVI
jgi:hypothetical protein